MDPEHKILNSINADLIIACVLGFGVGPLAEATFNATHLEKEQLDFHRSFLFGAANSVSLGARAWGLILLIHQAQEYFRLNILPISDDIDLEEASRRIGIIVWFCMTLSSAKRTIFMQAVAGHRLGRVGLYNTMLDFVLFVLGLANVLSVLSIEVGVGLQSIFAASGFSALAFSLASKGFVEQIIGGFFIHAWDAIKEGEIVRLGDGTEGVIRKIGLTETVIVGFDNIAVRIPNSQLTMQRVSNISRLKLSQIKQNIRLKYTDLDKIPKLLEDIKAEIKIACPQVITDGSKPFRVLITSYEADHIQVLINTHFPFRPMCADYHENRQNLLLAVAKAMKQNEMHFAIPEIKYETQVVPTGQ